MIFIAKNEKGEYTWKLALEKRKTVTRRLKPLPVGKEFAIQPGRGKFAVCRARVISCVNSHRHLLLTSNNEDTDLDWMKKEAKKEGFSSWKTVIDFFKDKNIDWLDTFRIEFELLNQKELGDKGNGLIE